MPPTPRCRGTAWRRPTLMTVMRTPSRATPTHSRLTGQKSHSIKCLSWGFFNLYSTIGTCFSITDLHFENTAQNNFYYLTCCLEIIQVVTNIQHVDTIKGKAPNHWGFITCFSDEEKHSGKVSKLVSEKSSMKSGFRPVGGTHQASLNQREEVSIVEEVGHWPSMYNT